MFYRRSSGNSDLWSPPINLSQSPDGENRPQIKMDQRDRIHVVWDEGADWYAGKGVAKTGVYRRSDDSGTTWSPPVHFGLADDAVQQTALALTVEGNPLVVYRSFKGIGLYFQESADGGTTWSQPAQIPGVIARNIGDNNLDMYSLATDSAGRIHLLMVGFRSNDVGEDRNPWLLHLTWDGRVWSAPEVVMGNDLYPEWPHIVVSNGNHLHAVWFTRRREDLFASDQNPHYQVWYSSKMVDAPLTTVLPLFTPTPAAVPTATPQPLSPTPINVPLPPSAVRAPTLDGSPAWEAPGLSIVALALLPMIGLLVLLSGLIWIKRRHG
jgi:hypothetical protein